MSVTVTALHLEHAVLDVHDRHIERSATKVEEQHVARTLLVQTVGDRGRSRLVDDAQHVESSDGARILGRLTLRVVKVGRHRNHSLGYLLPQIVTGHLLHLGEYHR
mmetsp:Transcript_344/g.1009  ORF Transcript_344/g.1009 Transcript_344/m.1009 type:complete len:106 (-) Transcript_344:413-730(-)